jgi:hypothetical protein
MNLNEHTYTYCVTCCVTDQLMPDQTEKLNIHDNTSQDISDILPQSQGPTSQPIDLISLPQTVTTQSHELSDSSLH